MDDHMAKRRKRSKRNKLKTGVGFIDENVSKTMKEIKSYKKKRRK